MRTLIHISGLFLNWNSKALMEQLWEIYSEGRVGKVGHGFRAYLDSNDEHVQKILNCLTQHGLHPWPDGRPIQRGKEYKLKYFRQYDSIQDLASLPYVELFPGEDFIGNGSSRNLAREYSMLDEPCSYEISMLCTPLAFIVAQRAREALDAANLIGLKWLPVKKEYKSADFGLIDEEDVWWELVSDIILPPVSPSMTLVTREFKPFRGDFSEGCLRREEFYVHPELHYRREDLEQFEAFDAAYTYEMFAEHPRNDNRAMVVSNKFYQVCKEHNLRTGFVPVRLDD